MKTYDFLTKIGLLSSFLSEFLVESSGIGQKISLYLLVAHRTYCTNINSLHLISNNNNIPYKYTSRYIPLFLETANFV